MKRPNGQSAGAGSLKPLKNCVFESADAENLRCKSWMADARRSWHVAKCWRISCLSFVTAQRARGFESVPGRARKSRRYRALTQKWYRIVTSWCEQKRPRSRVVRTL